ncbi:hypothetical protein BKA69DRAFT_1127734 [Paraphysoderma sedebokerense]|nr:hypothetical protein BKA69DRAFT_1127734 [Paraphysoderma sedebokerense]
MPMIPMKRNDEKTNIETSCSRGRDKTEINQELQKFLSNFLKTFALSGSLKYGLSMLGPVLTGKVIKIPKVLLQALNRDTISFALFIGSLSSVYKLLFKFLRNKLSDQRASFIAGLISGYCILMDVNESRRTMIALLILTRSGHCIASYIARQLRESPASLEKIGRRDSKYEEDAIVWNASSASLPNKINVLPGALETEKTVANSNSFESRRQQILSFLLNRGGLLLMLPTMSQIVYFSGKYDRFGENAIRPYMRDIKTSIFNQSAIPNILENAAGVDHFKTKIEKSKFLKWFQNVVDRYGRKDFPHAMCKVVHPHSPSCTATSIQDWICAFNLSVKMYGPLHAALLLLNYQKVLKTPKHHIVKYFKSVVCSSLFLSSSSAVGWVVLCYMRRILGRDALPMYYINGLIGGLTILFEQPHRQLELALYCFPKALESFWRCLIKYNYIPSPRAQQSGPARIVSRILTDKRYGEPLYFSIAFGVLMTLYEKNAVVDKYRRVMDKLFK